MRRAIINTADAERVARYLPSNYAVSEARSYCVVILGEDVAGWTLDGYVLPRLASGMLYGKEVV